MSGSAFENNIKRKIYVFAAVSDSEECKQLKSRIPCIGCFRRQQMSNADIAYTCGSFEFECWCRPKCDEHIKKWSCGYCD